MLSKLYHFKHSLTAAQTVNRAASFQSPMVLNRSFAFLGKQQSSGMDSEDEVEGATEQHENIVFEIQNRCTSVERLLQFAQQQSQDLSLVQQSILLARLRTLLVERASSQEEEMSNSTLLNSQSLFVNTARALLRRQEELDLTSLASTISVISKNPAAMSIDGFVPDQTNLSQVEATVIKNFDKYIDQDVSVVISGLVKLGYTPRLILNRINQMK